LCSPSGGIEGPLGYFDREREQIKEFKNRYTYVSYARGIEHAWMWA